MVEKALATLREYVGTYSGQGVNHENLIFRGRFSLSAEIPGRGFALNYSATGLKKENYHSEHSLIGVAPDQTLALWIMSSNHPFIVLHVLRKFEESPEKKSLYFSCGDFNSKAEFREIIQMDLWENGDIGYIYHWGLPGMECEMRSGLRMNAEKIESLQFI